MDPLGTAPRSNVWRPEADLVRILARDDPVRMHLTEAEYRRASAMKQAIEGNPDLDKLSDYMYAQFAVACRGNIDDALEMCLGLQEFKKEYKILDTHEEGCRCIQEVFKLFPEAFLSFSFHETQGSYMHLQDMSKLDFGKSFTSHQHVETWIKAMYYFLQTYFPDMESTRKGIVVMLECKGLSVMRRDHLHYHKEMFSQLVSHYPANGQVKHFNTSVMQNLIVSMLRPLLPRHLRDRFHIGLQFDGDISGTFLTPTREASEQRMIGRMSATLQLRYENERLFSL